MRISDWSSDVCSSYLRIRQKQAHAAVEKSKFAKAMFQLVEIELCDLEGGGGRQKRHHRSLPVRISHNLEWRFCIPVAEAHVMLLAVTPDREVQPIAERVHDGNTHA